MKDYTGKQTCGIENVPRMPGHDESRELSQVAQAAFQARFGKRPKHIHVKGSSVEGRWHFSPEFGYYIVAYPTNKTVVAVHDKLVGWATHAEIKMNWYDCGSGCCFDGPLHPMETFQI